MAGSLKLDGSEFLVKEGGQFKITNSELKLKSSGNTVVDSSGNAVISESGGNVTLGNVRLPASGGIKNSSGNDVISESGGVVTVKNAQLQAKSTIASYAWDGFSPSNLLATISDGPSNGTVMGNDYLTFSNSSGTLTFTCLVAGKYKFSNNYWVNHGNVYDYDTLYLVIGGTATRNTIITTASIYGPSQNNGNTLGSWGFVATATANQTVTILPQYRLDASGGTTTQHAVYVNTDIIYCGS